MAPLGGLAMVRPGCCARGVCGEDGRGSSTCARAEKRTVGSSNRGVNSPRPSAEPARGGTGDEGTRDTASTRARASRSAGWNQPGGLRDATRVTGCGGSHAPRECVRLPKQQLCPSTPNRVAVRRRERVRAAWARLGSSGCVRARVTPSPGSACGAAVRCDANPDAKPVNIGCCFLAVRTRSSHRRKRRLPKTHTTS